MHTHTHRYAYAVTDIVFVISRLHGYFFAISKIINKLARNQQPNQSGLELSMIFLKPARPRQMWQS